MAFSTDSLVSLCLFFKRLALLANLSRESDKDLFSARLLDNPEVSSGFKFPLSSRFFNSFSSMPLDFSSISFNSSSILSPLKALKRDFAFSDICSSYFWISFSASCNIATSLLIFVCQGELGDVSLCD